MVGTRLRHPISIAQRLTLFYTLSASGLLLVSGIYLYAVLTSGIEYQDTKFLADEVEGLRSILRDKDADVFKELEQEINWEGNASKYLKYYVFVRDENGKIVTQTASAQKSGISDIPFQKPFDIQERPDEGVKWHAPSGKTYFLMSAWAQTGPDGNTRWLLQLAYDITDDEGLLAIYRRRLFVVLFAGVVLASVAGALIAKRGLHPLRTITESIQRISAAKLHARISGEKWPRELVTLADEFDQMLGRLEGSFRRLSQFSADLAHELRTPIQNLMGETEVALSKVRTSEDYREVLESNLEEYAGLSGMIDSLLFLARADNPETVIEKKVSEVRREAEKVIEYYDAVAKEKGVAIHCLGEATLWADFSLVRRALSNLVSNALQHSPEGGEVLVRIEVKKGGPVEIRVSDQGAGISAKHLPRIFDRFYRAEFSRSRHPGGTGLGLAIVQSIMKLHHGTVAVDSASGKGAAFILVFPPNQITKL